MLISSLCFRDEELKTEVENEYTHQNQKCEVCGNTGNLIEIEYFDDFFVTLLSLFKKDSKSTQSLIDSFQSKWMLFSEKSFGEIILSDILSRTGSPLKTNDPVSYNDDIQHIIYLWRNIKKDLTTKLRYFVDYDEFEENGFISFNDDGFRILKKGSVLYRGRITDEGRTKMRPDEMKCPPIGKARPGRANPMGIPYLYLCQDIRTTLYEVRAGYLDNISVGKFKTLKELKIIDFDFQLSPYPVFIDAGKDELIRQIIKNEVLSEIRHDLSKPLTRYDTDLEYVPTQWICEYCKINNADGISFASSLDKDGVNYVLFNQDDVECITTNSHIIKNITISE